MKNKGIKIGVVFILLFALLSVAGCQQEDVVIVGAEPGQPSKPVWQQRNLYGSNDYGEASNYHQT